MIKAYKQMLQRFLDFNGRTSRRDYWLAVLANFCIVFAYEIIILIISLILGLLSKAVTGRNFNIALLFNIPLYLYDLFLLVAGTSMAIRRLHDSNKTGWLLVACMAGSLCCGLGSIAFIILMCLPGTPGQNNYGQDQNGGYNNFNNNGFGNGMNTQYYGNQYNNQNNNNPF